MPGAPPFPAPFPPSAPAARDPFAIVGTVLERKYRVDTVVAEGGYGVVYAGHHLALDVKVAIKVLKPARIVDPADLGERLLQFLDEGKALARLRHPSVVAVLDTGVTHAHAAAGSGGVDLPWMVLEWLEGTTLSADLAARRGRGGRTPAECMELVGSVVDAIAQAHEAGIAHRDLKPSNVMLVPSVRGVTARVLDFGIAKMMEPDADTAPTGDTSTQSNRSAYTAASAAPEQIAGTRTGPWTDVFALALILTEMLVDAPPYLTSDATERAAALFAAERPTPLARGVDVGAWEAVLARALAVRPADRPANARALLAELESALPGATHSVIADARTGASSPALVVAVTATTGAPAMLDAPPRPRARPVPAWLFAIPAALVIAGGAAGWRAWRAAKTERAAADRQASDSAKATPPRLAFHPKNPRRVTFDEGCELSPTFTPDGKALVYKAMGNTDSAPLLLRAIGEGDGHKLTPEKAFGFNPAVSPDGTTIAYKRWSKGVPIGLYLMPLAGEGALHLLADGVGHPSWTGDGRALWGENRTSLVRVRSADGVIEETLPAPAGYRPGPVLELDDGSLVAVFPRYLNTNKSGVAVIAPASAGRTLRWLAQGDFEETLALSPDRRHVLAVMKLANGEPTLLDVPLDGAPTSSLADSGIFPTRGIAVAPDGHGLAWSTCRDYVRLARMDADGKAADLDAGNGWEDRRVEWLAKAERLVVLSSRGGNGFKPWVIDPARKDAPRPVAVGELDVTSIAPSPDGALLALVAAGAGLLVVPVDGSAPPRALTTNAADCEPTFRHGGREILFERPSGDGASRIMAVPLEGGEPRTLLEGRVRAPAASPVDDRILYFEVGEKAEMTFMIFDPPTGKRGPVSPEMQKTIYTAARFSLDGKRGLAVSGGQVLKEVDLATRKVTWRSLSTDGLDSFVSTPGGIFVTHLEWAGDVWVADDVF